MAARSLMGATVLLAGIQGAFAQTADGGAGAPVPVPRVGQLKVPGAQIYYEFRGSGPMLLLIPGGPADAGVFAGLSERLADRYTVVAYDPRGNSRSAFDGAPEEQRLDVHGDDAARLIDALGDGPAYVFGTSGGAQIGLDLAARHPQRVRVLVAHEPPCILLLDDPSKALSNNQELYTIYRRQGVGSAMQRFMVMNGMADPQRAADDLHAAPSPTATETFKRIEGNLDYFFRYGLGPLALYRPDVEMLRMTRAHVIVAVGQDTEGQTANRTARALAAKLQIEPVVFAGDHGGYGPHAASFAEQLHRVLQAR